MEQVQRLCQRASAPAPRGHIHFSAASSRALSASRALEAMLALAQPPAPAPSLLDVVARAPGAAALIVEALGPEERRALRLAHSVLRDVVALQTRGLKAMLRDRAGAAAARPPTALSWPRLEVLELLGELTAGDLDALGSAVWEGLEELCFSRAPAWMHGFMPPVLLSGPRAHALTDVLAHMPTLRRLRLGTFLADEGPDLDLLFGAAAAPCLEEVYVAAESAAAVVPALAEAWLSVPLLRALHLSSDGNEDGRYYEESEDEEPADGAALPRALAATGWRLEELSLISIDNAGVAALAGAPSFELRCLQLAHWSIGGDGLRALATAQWPLQELVLDSCNDGDGGVGRAFEDLARLLSGLRKLRLQGCYFSADCYESLLCANLSSLTLLCISHSAEEDFHFFERLHADLFAGFPNLERLILSFFPLGVEGHRLLASRSWHRLREMYVEVDEDDETAELARGACRWPALERVDIAGANLTLEDVQRWAPRAISLLLSNWGS